MTKSDHAIETFSQGFSCSQAVLSAFADEMGLERQTALRLAGAFGGGMARQGLTCGAVTGALMVIGLQYGKALPEDNAARERTYELAQAFLRRFEARHGATACRQLLGYNLSDEQERKAASDAGLFTTLCPLLVGDAAQLAAELIGMP